MLDVKAKEGLDRWLAPLGRGLARIRITPTGVTIAGLVVTIVGGVFIAIGWLVAGAAVSGFGSVLDVIDGPLARATGRVSLRGALLDTLADRLGEVAVWVGLAYYVADDPARVTLCVVCLAGALLVPFVRSKAEGWGAEGKGGIMGRAERLLVMLLSVGLEGMGVELILPMLWVVAALTWTTVGQRAYRTWVQLGRE